jgi:Leucine-rich repeat (LRR) protein
MLHSRVTLSRSGSFVVTIITLTIIIASFHLPTTLAQPCGITEAARCTQDTEEQFIDCHKLSFSLVPCSIPTGFTKLDLSGNVIHSIPAGVFNGAGYDSLSYIDLVNNGLEFLQPGSFEGLPSLNMLLLNGNSITVIPQGAFVMTTSLLQLQLNSNRISYIAPGAFGVDGVDPPAGYLDLSDNAAMVLDNGALGNVQSVVLIGQKVMSIAPNSFDANYTNSYYCGFVEDRVINMCNIHSCYRQCGNSGICGVPGDRIIRHNTSFNCFPLCDAYDISELCLVQSDGAKGWTVDCTYRAMALLPCALPDGTTSLLFQGNQLNELPMQMFTKSHGYGDLQSLYLGFNQISELNADLLDGLDALHVLNLQDNELNFIYPGTFENMSSLATLVMSGSQPIPLFSGTFSGIHIAAKISLIGQNVSILAAGAFPFGMKTFACGDESWSPLECHTAACMHQCGIGATCVVNGIIFPDTTFTCSTSSPTMPSTTISTATVPSTASTTTIAPTVPTDPPPRSNLS